MVYHIQPRLEYLAIFFFSKKKKIRYYKKYHGYMRYIYDVYGARIYIYVEERESARAAAEREAFLGRRFSRLAFPYGLMCSAVLSFSRARGAGA